MSKKRQRHDETEEERKERKRAKKEEKKRKKNKKEREHDAETNETSDPEQQQQLLGTAWNVVASTEPPAVLAESVFHKKRIQLVVSLYPSALGNVMKSLQESLYAFLLKYSDGIGGILLGFDDLTIVSDGDNTLEPTGRILNELPYIHYRVACNALVFHPFLGCQLTGVVNENFPSHIGMLVFHYFNAMVSAEQLRSEGYNFDSYSQQWVHSESGKVVSSNDRIDFKVDKIHECGGTLSLEGSHPSLFSNPTIC